MDEELIRESYLDQEVDVVKPFDGPAIRFSHIEANDDGLRPYQSEMKQQVYDLWDRIDNVMLQMPTGTGKTIVFTSIVRDIRKWCLRNSIESKILIIAHRKELIDQASNKLGSISLEIYLFHFPVQIAIKIIDIYWKLDLNYSCDIVWMVYVLVTIVISLLYHYFISKKVERIVFYFFRGRTVIE